MTNENGISSVIDNRKVFVMKRKLMSKLKLKAMLLKNFGSPFIKLIQTFFNSGSNVESIDLKNFDITKFVPAISELFESIDADVLAELISDILQGVFVDDRDISNDDILNEVIDDDMILLYKIIWFVLQTHFKSFFLKMQNTKVLEQTEKIKEKLNA